MKKSLTLSFFYVIMFTIVFSFCVTTAARAAMPANKRVVTVDAGHGDWDPGKTGGKVNEKDINLVIAEKLQQLLELGGSVVFLTRAEDRALAESKRGDLNERASLANAAGSDIFISVHQNSYESPDVSGAQVFYHPGAERSKVLAEAVQERLNAFLPGQYRREAKAGDGYYVLRKTEMPAIIVECGFMSNPRELKLLQEEDFQNRVAWSVYMGVTDFFDMGK